MFINRIAIFYALTIMLVLLFVAPIAMGASDDAVGTIKGKVNYCDKGGYLGMQVFIPGRQFMVLLGQDGKFLFENVPVGKYDINYVINGRMVNVNKDISVRPGDTNDLGNIVFCADDNAKTSQPENAVQLPLDPCESDPSSENCVDADKDGVVAAKDCNDNNSSIKPGAVEICDGLDNNCNGQIDELVTVGINNGTGSCSGGKVSVLSCKKGFDDCDKDPSNGCEVDIFNDNENCGSCGNECSSLSTCGLGMC